MYKRWLTTYIFVFFNDRFCAKFQFFFTKSRDSYNFQVMNNEKEKASKKCLISEEDK